MRTPAVKDTLAEVRTPRTPRPPTQDETTRHDYFQTPVKKLLENAISSGYLLSWEGNGVDLENPTPFIWPADEEGKPIDPAHFSEAFQKYDFILPQCACATQDHVGDSIVRRRLYTFRFYVCRRPDSMYYGRVICSCLRQRQGCNLFVALDTFIANPDLVTKLYSRRPINGEGIRNFDPASILSESSFTEIQTPATPSRKRTMDSTSQSAAKLQKTVGSKESSESPPQPGRSDKSIGKRRLNVSNRGTRGCCCTSAHDKVARDISSDEDGEVLYSPVQSRRPENSAKIPKVSVSLQPSRRRVSGDHPPHYATINPQCTPIAHSIIDRYYGETSMLMDLPEPEASLLRNRELPPLRGQALKDVLMDLDSIRGINAQKFWQTVDKCECGQYFTKRALHDEHSQVCPYWYNVTLPSSSQPHCSSVLSSTEVERILDVMPSQVRAMPSPSTTRHEGEGVHVQSSASCSYTPVKRLHAQSCSTSHSQLDRDRILEAMLGSPPSSISREIGTSMSSPPVRDFPESNVRNELGRVLRSPYPIVPHPSPASPLNSLPADYPSDVPSSSQGSSECTSSDGFHTIQEDVLNGFLDSISFDSLGTTGQGASSSNTEAL